MHVKSGLELEDRRQRVGKGTNPSLRTMQSTGLATARADLARKPDESAAVRFFGDS